MNQLPSPKDPHRERDAIIAEIYAAWKGVTREGGVSWSEAKAIDSDSSNEERAAARASDTESHWEELVDDPNWYHTMLGGYCFLDAIGFRYYIAPELARCVRSTNKVQFCDSPLQFWLELDVRQSPDGPPKQWQFVNARQRTCIARSLRFIASNSQEVDAEGWWRTYSSYWKHFDTIP